MLSPLEDWVLLLSSAQEYCYLFLLQKLLMEEELWDLVCLQLMKKQ